MKFVGWRWSVDCTLGSTALDFQVNEESQGCCITLLITHQIVCSSRHFCVIHLF